MQSRCRSQILPRLLVAGCLLSVVDCRFEKSAAAFSNSQPTTCKCNPHPCFIPNFNCPPHVHFAFVRREALSNSDAGSQVRDTSKTEMPCRGTNWVRPPVGNCHVANRLPDDSRHGGRGEARRPKIADGRLESEVGAHHLPYLIFDFGRGGRDIALRCPRRVQRRNSFERRCRSGIGSARYYAGGDAAARRPYLRPGWRIRRRVWPKAAAVPGATVGCVKAPFCRIHTGQKTARLRVRIM